jgi:hypothetical protein
MTTQPGCSETALHQALTPDADFVFVNITRRQTAEAFGAVLSSAGFRESAAGLAATSPTRACTGSSVPDGAARQPAGDERKVCR